MMSDPYIDSIKDPVHGFQYWDTTRGKLVVYDGNEWLDVILPLTAAEIKELQKDNEDLKTQVRQMKLKLAGTTASDKSRGQWLVDLKNKSKKQAKQIEALKARLKGYNAAVNLTTGQAIYVKKGDQMPEGFTGLK